MRRNSARGTIRPKISTMPRQKSEAAAFLDIYKLVVEKKRLQQELQTMDERRKQICDRLAVLDQRVAELEGSVQQLRATEGTSTPPDQTASRAVQTQSGQFETLFLEY